MDALSPPVARHLTVGCSTGYMVDARGDWPALVETSAATSTLAVELSALGEEELPRLVDFLQGDPPMPFHYVSVHAPSKNLSRSERDRVAWRVRRRGRGCLARCVVPRITSGAVAACGRSSDLINGNRPDKFPLSGAERSSRGTWVLTTIGRRPRPTKRASIC